MTNKAQQPKPRGTANEAGKDEERKSDASKADTPEGNTPPAEDKATPDGPIARQEIRLGGKTYGPGEPLPGNMAKGTRDRLEELRAIDTE